MKPNKKTYWKGLEQLRNDPEFVKYANKEFAENLPLENEEGASQGHNRRDFLKTMGFGIAAATMAACETPVRYAIPYVNKPVDVAPGIPNYYASTHVSKGDYCSIVVKTREGRPIKVEGNNLSSVTMGGVNAQVEASVLDLYDNTRIPVPTSNGEKTTWQELDDTIINQLTSISRGGGQIRLVSNTILSPTSKKVISGFTRKYPGSEHITYDARSAYGMRLANERSFGKSIIPTYDFSKLDVVAGFSADFLGTWIAPTTFTKQFSKTRKLGQGKKTMSRHYQFESLLSLTGANADYRTPIKASQEGVAIAKLYNLLAAKAGASSINANDIEVNHLQKAADELWNSRGKSLVVSGSNDPNVQELVNNINMLLGAYEAKIIDINAPSYYRQGNDEQMYKFVQDVKNKNIDAVIFLESNPVYDHPLGNVLAENLPEIPLVVATSYKIDETSQFAKFLAPVHHYLESWNDAEPQRWHYSLMQPAISPLFETRQMEESLLVWSNNEVQDYYTYLQNNWKANYFALQNETIDFQTFWDKTLYEGIFEYKARENEAASSLQFASNLTSIAGKIQSRYKVDSQEWEILLYEKVGIGTGAMANNPWLQEMPDPISRITWDNYLTIPQRFARENNIKTTEGRTVKMNIQVDQLSFDSPVVEQPGQAQNTFGIALGYGRTKAGAVADNLGTNAFPLVQYIDGALQYAILSGVKHQLTSDKYQLAHTQTHHTYMGRETVIQESVLPEYKENPAAGRYTMNIHTSEGDVPAETVTLWKEHTYNNHHWGLIVDLNSCTGCGACTIACQVENNVPVVGKQEVINRREMHWIRIDRYYSSDADVTDLKGLEVASDNPEVVFQPVMCQHCNNAPCETVCPVVATTHSTEGLNQMTYNRCIGTRYCANNCPYKVRRFNWFKYHDNKQFKDVNKAMYDDLGKMVLNPDVTVRSRGVMEKCSFCVQRIQYGKLEAKKEGRRPIDGEINTACAKACPAEALIFGDLNDPESNISKHLGIEEETGGNAITVNEPRAYNMLAEINVRPNVFYLTKIRNKDSETNSEA